MRDERVLTVDKSVENELAVLLDKVVDVTKDSTGMSVSADLDAAWSLQHLPHCESPL